MVKKINKIKLLDPDPGFGNIYISTLVEKLNEVIKRLNEITVLINKQQQGERDGKSTTD